MIKRTIFQNNAMNLERFSIFCLLQNLSFLITRTRQSKQKFLDDKMLTSGGYADVTL